MGGRRKRNSHGEQVKARAFDQDDTQIQVVRVYTRCREEEKIAATLPRKQLMRKERLISNPRLSGSDSPKVPTPTDSKKRKLFSLSGRVRTRRCPVSYGIAQSSCPRSI